LHAATYYVSSAGTDSNDGSSGLPWLTLQYAVNHVACGDTIIVVANGMFIDADANLPLLGYCANPNIIKSSLWSLFAPSGYRTNPVNDSALYGKLQFTNHGISAAAEVHGSWSSVSNTFSRFPAH
jgi:hypothetical protein